MERNERYFLTFSGMRLAKLRWLFLGNDKAVTGAEHMKFKQSGIACSFSDCFA